MRFPPCWPERAGAPGADRLLSLCSPRASGLLSQDEGEGGWSARPRAPNCIGDRMSKTPAREAQGLPTPLTRPPLGPPHT